MPQFKGSQAEGIISYEQECKTFCSIRPSTDWMRPTHIRVGQFASPSLSIQMLISSKNPVGQTQNNV